MEPWYLRRADVTYRCIGCQLEATLVVELPERLCVVGGMCSRCLNLMGISNVRYYTNDDDLPTDQDTNVSTSDREAAAVLGIDLQPAQGGADESENDDDVYRN